MKNQSKQNYAVICAALAVLFFLPMLTVAGDLEPTAAPDNATSAMYTLEDIYNYLDTGVAGTKRPGGATEPTAVPASTGNTLDDIHEKIAETCFETCDGTLNGTRWCDQEDGTIKDMTTGLVWLKNANCFGLAPLTDVVFMEDAHLYSSSLYSSHCGLSDDSDYGEWRLPTLKELTGIASGAEAVSSVERRGFTLVLGSLYWTSTTDDGFPIIAFYVNMSTGMTHNEDKRVEMGVWPVRSDN